jgi:hypothetical protein
MPRGAALDKYFEALLCPRPVQYAKERGLTDSEDGEVRRRLARHEERVSEFLARRSGSKTSLVSGSVAEKRSGATWSGFANRFAQPILDHGRMSPDGRGGCRTDGTSRSSPVLP